MYEMWVIKEIKMKYKKYLKEEKKEISEAFNKNTAQQWFDFMWKEAEKTHGSLGDGMRTVLHAFRANFLE